MQTNAARGNLRGKGPIGAINFSSRKHFLRSYEIGRVIYVKDILEQQSD